jgi:hypothetical protein
LRIAQPSVGKIEEDSGWINIFEGIGKGVLRRKRDLIT